MKRRLLLVIGIIMILVALKDPMIGLTGKTSIAAVTRIKKDIGKFSKTDSYKYTIYYDFVASNGERYCGNYIKRKVYSYSELPGIGSILEIQYSGIFPGINIAKGKGMPAYYVVGLILGGTALVLLRYFPK